MFSEDSQQESVLGWSCWCRQLSWDTDHCWHQHAEQLQHEGTSSNWWKHVSVHSLGRKRSRPGMTKESDGLPLVSHEAVPEKKNMPQLRSSPGRSRARVSHEEEGRRGTQCPFSRVPLEHIKLSWKIVRHHGTMPLANHQSGSWSKKKSLAWWHSAALQRGSKAELGHPAGFAAGHRREKDYTNAPADGICFLRSWDGIWFIFHLMTSKFGGIYSKWRHLEYEKRHIRWNINIEVYAWKSHIFMYEHLKKYIRCDDISAISWKHSRCEETLTPTGRSIHLEYWL